MKFLIVKPNGFLKNYIKQYCFMESDVHEGTITERVIPTEHVQLMFHYRDPFVVIHSDHAIKKQPRSIISGLCESFSDVSTHGETGVVFISFYPAGACNFLHFPLSIIEDQSIDMSDIFSQEIRQVEELLYVSKTLKARVSVIEDFLLSHFSPIPLYDSLLIIKGIDMIKSRKGQTHASALSDSLSVTPKTLERKFSQYLGKTTKQVIKLMRFQEVLLDFSNHKNVSLTERAYRNGYFDQAHFIKDFKALSGYTPREFSAKYPDFNMNNEAC